MLPAGSRSISKQTRQAHQEICQWKVSPVRLSHRLGAGDRKSTRLNSSHLVISYAVFCLKKKKKQIVSRPLHRPTDSTFCISAQSRVPCHSSLTSRFTCLSSSQWLPDVCTAVHRC